MQRISSTLVVSYAILLISFSSFAKASGEFGSEINHDEVVLGRLANNETHSHFLEALNKASISYRINDRGFVVHKIKNTAEVLGIKRVVLYGANLQPEVYEVAGYSGDKEKKHIIEQLNAEKIPFEIKAGKEYPNMGWFYYSQHYGPKVDVIMQNTKVLRYGGTSFK